MSERRQIRRVLFATGLTVLMALPHPGFAASQPGKVTVHVPSKSLAIMPYYFGKDKGFFSPELVEPQLVLMSPPTAIASVVAGELDFASTLGAATSAMMRGLPLKRVFYVQQDPSHALLVQPEIKTIRELAGKPIAVPAITDAVGMAATVIMRANGVDASRILLLGTGVSDNAYRALVTGKVAATLMAPPYAEELESKGYRRLAEARTYAPLSFIGLVASVDSLKKNPQKAYALISGLYRTLTYLNDPVHRTEVIQYIATFHKIDLALAEKAFTTQMQSYSKDGGKPRKAVEREIEIYREILKIQKTFTPDDLEDLTLLRRVQESAAQSR